MDIFSFVLKPLCVFIFLSACDSETKYQACKCEGDLVSFENYRGIVALARTNEYIIISDQLGFISACAGLHDDMEVDGQKVIFSGRYIKNCQTPVSDYGITKMNVQVTSLTKSDTIFNSGPLIINIIPSQDYYGNYTNGFGYFINFKDIFKIKQRSIPNVGGYVPFKTSADAYKIAVRVGCKLNTSKDFPSINDADLYYLKIIN